MLGSLPWGPISRAIDSTVKRSLSLSASFNRVTAAVTREEKAVANYDEEGITMRVAAAMDCLSGFERTQSTAYI